MTAGEFKNGASRLWGAVDRVALTLAIAFAGYLFTSQQELGRSIERTNQRVTVIETVQLEGRAAMTSSAAWRHSKPKCANCAGPSTARSWIGCGLRRRP
jgi:hypothetical protein